MEKRTAAGLPATWTADPGPQTIDRTPTSSRAAGAEGAAPRCPRSPFPPAGLPGAGNSAGADDKKDKTAEVKKEKTAEVTERPGGEAGAAATPARISGAEYFPTSSTGMPRPDGAPEPKEDTRTHAGCGRNTPTDQAKRAYSTQQTEDKVHRLTAELTPLFVAFVVVVG